MNDPLKKYINQHREEFDSQEVPDELFDNIMAKLDNSTLPTAKTKALFSPQKWAIAASIAIIMGIGIFTFWPENKIENTDFAGKEIEKTTDENLVDILPKTPLETPKIKTTKQNNITVIADKKSGNLSQSIIEDNNFVPKQHPENNPISEDDNAFALLNNQFSASSRLQGIAMVKNFSVSDKNMINILSQKALSDENTNVRLAAVDALSSQIENPLVAKHIQQIFLHQNDPMVQKELIAILAVKKPNELSQEIYSKLKELTTNPTTEVFVKDEAYAVLMRY